MPIVRTAAAVLLLSVLLGAHAQVPPPLVRAIPQVRDAGAGAAGDSAIWPGFSFTQVCILVFDPASKSALLFHVDPLPQEFQPADPSAPGVGFGPIPSGEPPREGTGPVAGRLGQWVSADRLPPAPGPAATEFLYSRAFQVFEAYRGFPQPVGIPETEFPLYDAEFNALSRAEGAILLRALGAQKIDLPGLVAAFLSLRERRQSVLSEAARAYEWRTEADEGLAAYAGYVARSRTDAAGAAADLGRRLGDGGREGAGITGARFAATGCALALILDRIGVNWKAEFEKTSRESLRPTLAMVSAAATPADLGFANLADLRREEGEALARSQAEREARERAVTQADGLVVRINLEAALANPQVRWSNRYAPNGILKLDRTREIREKYYSLVGEGHFEFASSRPILIETRKGMTAGFAAGEVPYMTLDGQPLSLSAGQVLEGSLEIRGNQLTLKVDRARLTYSPKTLVVEPLLP
ncbi:MAG: hypothetical protein ACOYXN_01020 [Acidobacteriota bacterium]